MARVIELEDRGSGVVIDRRFRHVVIASFYGETTENGALVPVPSTFTESSWQCDAGPRCVSERA